MGGQAAEGILAGLAQLPPGFLPAPLFAPAADGAVQSSHDPERLQAAIAALLEAGDLERRGRRMLLSAEVRERVREELDYRQSVAATEDALALVLAAFPADPGDYRNWKRCRALMPVLRGVTRRAAELEMESPRAVLALALGSEFLTAGGNFSEAQEFARAAFLQAPPSLELGLEATRNHALGVILIELGELGPARRALEQARASRSRMADADPLATRADELALGEVLGDQGDFAAAGEWLGRVATQAGVPVDRFDAQARRRLAWLAMEEGELEEAERLYRQALTATEALLGADHPDTAQARGELGALLLESSRWEEARVELEGALQAACDSLGDDHPAVAVIASNLGGALEGLERFAEARDAVERSLAIGREALPDGHRNLWLRHRKLTRILRSLDQREAAREHAEAAAAISEKALPPEDPEAARDQVVLAAVLTRFGERADARQRYERALPVLEVAEGPDSPEVAEHQLTYGGVLVGLGDLVAARPPLESAYVSLESIEGSAEVRARIELLNLARRLAEERAATLERLGRAADAETEREAERESRRGVLEEIAADGGINSTLLAARAAGTGMPDLAETALAQALKTAEAFEGEEERAMGLLGVRLTWGSLGLDAYLAERYDESRRFYEMVFKLAQGDPVAEGEALDDLGDVAAAEDDEEGAVRIYGEALERKRQGGGDDVTYTLLLLGRAQKRLQRYAEAEAAFGERLTLLRSDPERRPLAEAVTLHDLANVSVARGEFEAAIAMYGEAAELKRQFGEDADLATTLQALGAALRDAGRVAEAADALAECVRLLASLSEPAPFAEAIALEEFADLRRLEGDLEAAVALYRRALARGPFEDPMLTPYLLYRLAGGLEKTGDPTGAENALTRRLEILHELDGVDWEEGITLVDLGRLREESDDPAGALERYREGVAKLADAKGPAGLAAGMKKLGDGLVNNGDLEEAIEAYEEAIRIWRAEDEEELASRALLDLARTRYAKGDFAAAAARFEERLALLARFAEPNRRAESITLHHLAETRRAENRPAEAISLYREAVARRREAEGETNIESSLLALAATLLEANERDEGAFAAEVTEVADEFRRASPTPTPLDLATIKTMVAVAGGLEGEVAGTARAEASEAIAAAVADPDLRSEPEPARVLLRLAAWVDDADLIDTILVALRELTKDGSAEPALDSLIEALRVLGRKRLDGGDLEGAEELFGERLSLIVAHPKAGPNPEGIARHDLARVFESQGRRDEAIPLYREAVELKREAGNELGVARSLLALAKQLGAAGDDEAHEVVARSVELFREQVGARPMESSAALVLLALLEDDDGRARGVLAEAKGLVETIPADDPQREIAGQNVKKGEEAIALRSERSD